MTFGLIGWLKSRFTDLNFEVPIWYPSREQADHREWLITNGLGGFASGTISGAHTRRYHGMLIAALKPPSDRHLILSRLDEIVRVGDKEYLLATNHWASGVVSPTGFKFIESFSALPVPTWVFELDGDYLIKQICLGPGAMRSMLAITGCRPKTTPPQPKSAFAFSRDFATFTARFTAPRTTAIHNSSRPITPLSF